MKGISAKFIVAAILLALTAAFLQARARNEVFPPRVPLASLPLRFNDWSSDGNIQLDQQTLDILGAGEFLLRDYRRSESQPPINLFIAYFPSQKTGDTIHSPNHCLPGAGWVPTQRKIVSISGVNGSSFPANRYVISRGGAHQIVLYWYLAHGRAIASEYSAKYYLVADSIRLRRSDGALVRLISPMYQGETPDAAQARIMGLGGQLIPVLDTYIPR